MSWLKYEGSGRTTSSPGSVSAIIARQNAWLQPAVTATRSTATGAS